jgi:tetratricopeptide (TPR) repeat protein
VSEENESKPEAEAETKEAPAAPKKKKAKAEGGESIKDRNQRIREEAAARRRGKRDEERRRAAPARNLDASEIVDDALARGTHNAALLLRKHFNKIQWAAVLIIVGGIGYKIYTVRAKRTVGDNSDKLLAAISAERARIGEAASGPAGMSDARQHFPSDEARLKAAAEAYQTASAVGGNTATLARLGQAGIFYDQGKYQDALKAYQDVRAADLASRDEDIKGRALEGVGLSQEALGQLDAALKTFRELENSGISGFAPLGEFHQARILRAKGDNEQAKRVVQQALDKLKEKAKERAPGMPPSYLQRALAELQEVLDPAAAAASIKNMDPALFEKLGGEPGKGGVDPGKLQELLKQVQEAATGSPEAPAPPQQAPQEEPAPAPPASAP